MTDSELLEAAAKAAGIPNTGEMYALGLKLLDGPHNYWNPFAVDGDALRLAVKLGIVVEYRRDVAAAFAYHYARALQITQNNIGLDPNATTRRAIVRAAAAMAGVA